MAMMPVWAEVALKLVGCLLAFLTLPLLVGQLEHKTMAHMQSRLGPMYAGGFHGWAQLVADGVKFAQKEQIVPAAADSVVFRLAPVVALLPYLLVLAVIPIGPSRDCMWAIVLCSSCPTSSGRVRNCLLYTSPSPRDGLLSRMPSSA